MNPLHLRSGAMLLARRPQQSIPLLYRCASTNSSTTSTIQRNRSPPLSPATKPAPTVSITADDAINAPISSIPAPIELPTKAAGDSTFGHLFRTGKAYLSFFKSGMMAILTNFKATRGLQELVDKHEGGLQHLVQHGLITRAQYQHLLRARHDIVRVPLFGLIFIVFGETSPFILPFIPNTVPYPCRVPQQLNRQRRKAAEAREAAFRALTVEEAAALRKGLDQLSSQELAHVATVLRVNWFLRKWRLKRHVEYLDHDSALLLRGGGVDGIASGEELTMAAEDRGISTYGKKEEEIRDTLRDWERVVKALGGVRPGAWLVRPESWRSAGNDLRE